MKVGDKLTRVMGGVEMPVTIKEIDGDVIICKGDWTFDFNTGMEMDCFLGWGPAYGVTGSYIKELMK